MPLHTGPTKTLSPDNQFCFNCPIFGAEVELRGCMALNEHVMKGKQIEKRRGCQAAMAATKCPTYWIVREMTQTGEDPYHSTEKRVGRLSAKILDQVTPIIVSDRTMDEWGVSAGERDLLTAANSRTGSRRAIELEEVEVKPKRRAKKSDDTLEAAATGDMAAAITVATEKAKEAPPAAPVTTPAPKPATPPASVPDAGKPLSLLERARLRKAAA